ncbi:MAG: hypothetical protein WCO26_07620 [Deltaproteobacteria bacterium]
MPKKAIYCIFALLLLSFSPSFPLSHAEELRKLDSQETAIPVVTGDGNSPQEKIPKDSSTGHDILVRELGLTEDLELYVVVSNAGEGDLPKGSTLRIRIFVNDRKISDFEHLTARVLKGKIGNHYTVRPPYPVAIGGISLVRASVWPTLPSQDIDPRNNTLARNFIIYPFRIEPRAKQEFSFSIFPPRVKTGDLKEKVSAEVRWDGDGFPLKLSFRGSGRIKGDTTISGKSPLKMEVPISFEETDKREACHISVTNPLKQKVVGHVIIQHP